MQTVLLLGAVLGCTASPALAQEVTGDSNRVYGTREVDDSPRVTSLLHLRGAGQERMVRFVVRVVVDTLGHPEPGSLSVVQTEDSSLDAMAEGLVRVARFRPGRIHGHPVRTFVDIPVLLPASVGSTRLATVTNMVEQAPQLISGPPLVYPVGLERYGVEGQVILQAIIDTTGRAEPASLKILQSPDPAFERVALAWIKEARFRPAKLNGRPVRVLVSVPLDFRAPRR